MPAEGLNIRIAAPADVTPLVALLAELNRGLERPVESQPADWERNLAELIDDPHAHLLIAEVSGNVAGLLTLNSRVTVLHERRVGLIDELVVAEAHRGRGVGRALISAAAEFAQQAGWSEIEVSTESSNQAAAAFYLSCGFSQEAVLLERHLGEAGGRPES